MGLFGWIHINCHPLYFEWNNPYVTIHINYPPRWGLTKMIFHSAAVGRLRGDR